MKQKVQRLTAKEVLTRSAKEYDAPGCCNMAVYIIHYNGKRWVHETERMPGDKEDDYQLRVYFCPFCGTKLNEETPVAKR
jgi:hypothetical protein